MVPGVFLIEAVRCAAEHVLDKPLRLKRVTDAKFTAEVAPDVKVTIEATLDSDKCRATLRTPDAVAASIRIVDSLQDGVSHFYAEILRLRQVLELTSGDTPVLFLLDEILHGTNSHDRRIGAEAVVRGLVERGAVGFITTHDLALSKMADAMNKINRAATNVHFEDQIVDGKIQFDYIMREGVVTKSNALDLMRSVGLEV